MARFQKRRKGVTAYAILLHSSINFNFVGKINNVLIIFFLVLEIVTERSCRLWNMTILKDISYIFCTLLLVWSMWIIQKCTFFIPFHVSQVSMHLKKLMLSSCQWQVMWKQFEWHEDFHAYLFVMSRRVFLTKKTLTRQLYRLSVTDLNDNIFFEYLCASW